MVGLQISRSPSPALTVPIFKNIKVPPFFPRFPPLDFRGISEIYWALASGQSSFPHKILIWIWENGVGRYESWDLFTTREDLNCRTNLYLKRRMNSQFTSRAPCIDWIESTSLSSPWQAHWAADSQNILSTSLSSEREGGEGERERGWSSNSDKITLEFFDLVVGAYAISSGQQVAPSVISGPQFSCLSSWLKSFVGCPLISSWKPERFVISLESEFAPLSRTKDSPFLLSPNLQM